jgi:hypothetical protein
VEEEDRGWIGLPDRTLKKLGQDKLQYINWGKRHLSHIDHKGRAEGNLKSEYTKRDLVHMCMVLRKSLNPGLRRQYISRWLRIFETPCIYKIYPVYIKYIKNTKNAFPHTLHLVLSGALSLSLNYN